MRNQGTEDRKVLVLRLIDKGNNNAQASNARNILARWTSATKLVAGYSDKADPRLVKKQNLLLFRVWPWRFWKLSIFIKMQSAVRLFFYTQADVHEVLGILFRDLTGRSIPIVSTCEGLVGYVDREQRYSAQAGHHVYCQPPFSPSDLKREEWLYARSDHIIAVSPFLARMMRRQYGEKVSFLPLGIDSSIFFSRERCLRSKVVVVSAGRVAEHKRPYVFLQLAKQHPEVQFKWFGWGESREELIGQCRQMNLSNLSFPGPVSPAELAHEFRKADLFVLPSRSEGVPKVTQEAAACGLPVVLFGFYEAPSVIDGKNGFVVWDDEELYERVDQLITQRDLRATMSDEGAKMAKEWDWDVVAPLWEARILHLLEGAHAV